MPQCPPGQFYSPFQHRCVPLPGGGQGSLVDQYAEDNARCKEEHGPGWEANVRTHGEGGFPGCRQISPGSGEKSPFQPNTGPKIRTGFQEISRTRTGPDPLPGIGLNEIAQMFAFQRLAKETGGDDLAKFFSTLDPTSGPSLDRPGTTSDLLALPGAKTGEGITTGGFLFGDVPDVLRNFNRTIFNTLPGGTVERRVPGNVIHQKAGFGQGLPPNPGIPDDFPNPHPQVPGVPIIPPVQTLGMSKKKRFPVLPI